MSGKKKVKASKADKSALEIIEASIALGGEISALVGMVFYEAQVIEERDYHYILGYYSSKEEALKAVASWVVSQYDEMDTLYGSAPWADNKSDLDDEEARKDYLKKTSPKEIARGYFSSYDGLFEIKKHEILKPDPIT